jgi:predicted dehydrogenase
MRVRLGVVGCGGVAQAVHLPVLSVLADQFQVVAVTDVNLERAILAASRFGVPLHFTSIEEMLNTAQMDALVVLTLSHEECVEIAIDRGLHVFTEKPLSLDVSRSIGLCKAAKQAGVVLDVGLMRLHDRALQTARVEFPRGCARAGLFLRCDGSDASRRREMLSASMKPSTFDLAPPPHLPDHLSEKQVGVLTRLLWSGTHLLTALVTLFPGAVAYDTKLGSDGSLVCGFTGAAGEVIHVSLLNTHVPVYFDQIRVVAPERVGVLEFESPYQHPGRSKITIHTSSPSQASFCYNFEESAFRRMWESFHRRVKGEADEGENAISTSVECEVETLALSAAQLAE